jgi:hypothetical protein
VSGRIRKTDVLRWACVALVACCPARVWGQATSGTVGDPVALPGAAELAAIQIDPALRVLVERLGDPSYIAREAATAELLRGPHDNAQIYAVLSQAKLTAEQRHRLLSVLRERLLNTPRGAVGIKVDRRWLPEKVVIEELLPDLPARDVLQVGDRITHLRGVPLESWEAFVDTVQSSVPGTKITVTVERLVSGRRPMRRDVAVDAEEPQYQQLDIELRLGSADQLLDPVTGRPQIGGPVVVRKKLEADQALKRFGSEPKLIGIDEP